MKARKLFTSILTGLCVCLASTAILTACDKEHIHTYTQQTTAKATCTEKGAITYTCSCNDTYTEELPALGHDTKNHEAQAATCTEIGWEAYEACQREGCDYTTYEELPALGHDFTEYVPNNDATYQKDGTKTAECNRPDCKETDTIIDEGTKKTPTGRISFKTLTFEKEFELYGKTENAVTVFSFTEEIISDGGVQFTVGLDEFGLQLSFTKKVPLEVGDNVFYIFETIDGEIIDTYKVTIRRRPQYTVTFLTDGGTEIAPQTVEEDGFVTLPTTTKEGFSFNGWDYDFTTPITKDKTISASWTANDDTPYTVEHYLQNAENDEYTLFKTEDKKGTTNSTATAVPLSFEEYKQPSSIVSGKIVGDGSLVLKVYYNYKTFTVTFALNGGWVVSGQQTQTVKYGNDATAPTVYRNGYQFIQWDKTFTNVTNSLTVTASWQVLIYKISYSLDGGVIEDSANPTEYTTETNFQLVAPEKEYHQFLGWMTDDYHIISNLFGVVGDLHLTATWQCIFITSGNKLDGLTEYGKSYSRLELPAEINGTTITEISSCAFKDNSNLQEIILPQTITKIGREAFRNCDALKKVVLSENLAVIDMYAFMESDALSKIDIPNGVSTIEYSAFAYCNGLKSISIPASVTKIGDSVFLNCFALETIYYDANDFVFDKYNSVFQNAGEKGQGITVTFGKHITKIPDYIFCPSFSTVGISPKVQKVVFEEGNACTSIGKYAFYHCTSLTEMEFPDTLTLIDQGAFRNCSKLNNIQLGNKLASIIGEAFIYCESVTSLCIPANVQEIGRSAFAYCTALQTVTIAEGVTNLGDGAFYNCTALTTVTIPNTITSLTPTTFAMCPNLKCNEKDSLAYLGNSNNPYMLLVKVSSTQITQATIIEGCTTIGSYAFYECYELTSIIIPKSVTTIADAFFGCTRLNSVYYSATEGNWSQISIDSYNYSLITATRYYYSETAPALNADGTAYDGNYWYYDENNQPVVWVYTKE